MAPPWWLAARIEATVTRDYVASHLSTEQGRRLDEPVAFEAAELTTRTYWDSIRDRARRLFLILLDIGVPNQIFRFVDNGWADSELPLSLEDVERLQLTEPQDSRIDRKFHQRQYQYVLKALGKGDHHTYRGQDIIPLEPVDRFPGLKDKHNNIDRVRIPNEPKRVLTRRRFRLKGGPGGMGPQEFADAVAALRILQNDHIVSCWASYVHENSGYLLVNPVGELSLKNFLSSTPSSFKNLPKRNRRRIIMNWILCLVDTLAYLHSESRSHCHIKPSTILFTEDFHIVFSDSTRMNPESAIAKGDKLSFDREGYDFAAPEQWFRPSSQAGSGASPTTTNMYAGLVDPEACHISRGFDPALQNTNPSLNPQQADVFSLACIILELLSYLLKRSTNKFAACRSAKHKMAGRGGAVLDASFHRNLGQVEMWMSELAKEASKKFEDPENGRIFRGFVPILHVATSMLSVHPHERPSALEVKNRMYQILTQECGITEPHCVHNYPQAPSTVHMLPAAMEQMQLQGVGGWNQAPSAQRLMAYPPMPYGVPRGFADMRPNSSDGFSQYSTTDSGTNFSSRSSERESDIGVAVTTSMGAVSRLKDPGGSLSRTCTGQRSHLSEAAQAEGSSTDD